MANFTTQQKTISLGKQLVAELERQSDTNFMTSWMAHYLAAQITFAENATGRKKTSALKRCFETILTLWKHQASLPNGYRPFEEFEPIFAALHDLGLNNKKSYYHRFAPASRFQDSKEPTEVSQLIELIFAIDSAARVLIDTVLAELTRLAVTPRTKKLLQSAPRITRANATRATQILIDQMENLQVESDLTNRLIQERLQKLRAFSDTCQTLEKRLEKRLQQSNTTIAKKDKIAKID